MPTYIDPTTGKPYTGPPVIPEIAKAYQNDPKTQLALAALKAGTSSAPVARGGYGYGDGIARVAQALMGAKMEQQANAQYGSQQADLLALRKARGVDGLTGAGASIPNVAPPQTAPPPAAPGGPVPPAAPAIAAALGAPAPDAGPPQGAPGLPMALVPPPGPASGAMPPPGPPAPPQAPGGGPNGQPPFGPGGNPAPPPAPAPLPANAPPYLAAPTQEPVPAAPAPLAKPVAPTAIGPTKSRMLNAAYRLMADANPYESAQGQDMYQTGLTEQGKMDADATERAQKLQDMGYASDLSQFGTSQNQDREASIQERAAAIARNQAGILKYNDQLFEHGENGLKEIGENKRAALQRSTQVQVARIEAAAKEASAGVGPDGGGVLDQETLAKMAEQGLTGDMSVFQGLGRGQVQARNTLALRKEMYRQGALQGLSPADVAAKNAQFFGLKSEARAAGTRVGATDVSTGEVPGLATEALAAHAAVPTTSIVPFNKAMQMYQSGTSSPELARAVVATTALTNAYGRSFGTGQLADNARKEAASKLQNAWGTPAYASAVAQIQKTVGLERTGAKAALSNIGGTSPAPTGKTGNALVDKYLQ